MRALLAAGADPEAPRGGDGVIGIYLPKRPDWELTAVLPYRS